MDENGFARMQKFSPGFFPEHIKNDDGTFSPAYTEQKIQEIKLKKQEFQKLGADLVAEDESKLIFPLIFGLFGYNIDLDEALKQTQLLYSDIMGRKPEEPYISEDALYIAWLHEYAVAEILFGTIYSYKAEYVKAAYHFMLGMKTEMITLNAPYTDFIKYILNKLPVVNEIAEYSGCGFSVEDPMGSIRGIGLNASLAMSVIPQMEGDNGEVIIAHMGKRSLFGHLVRLGSAGMGNMNNIIDVYETYIIDNEYNIKRLILYFNGYMNYDYNTIKIATGFKIKSHSLLLDSYNLQNSDKYQVLISKKPSSGFVPVRPFWL